MKIIQITNLLLLWFIYALVYFVSKVLFLFVLPYLFMMSVKIIFSARYSVDVKDIHVAPIDGYISHVQSESENNIIFVNLRPMFHLHGIYAPIDGLMKIDKIDVTPYIVHDKIKPLCYKVDYQIEFYNDRTSVSLYLSLFSLLKTPMNFHTATLDVPCQVVRSSKVCSLSLLNFINKSPEIRTKSKTDICRYMQLIGGETILSLDS